MSHENTPHAASRKAFSLLRLSVLMLPLALVSCTDPFSPMTPKDTALRGGALTTSSLASGGSTAGERTASNISAQNSLAIEQPQSMPVDQGRTLQNMLIEQSVRHGIPLIVSQSPTEQNANYALKIVAQAASTPKGAILIYVGDLIDAMGTRQHRVTREHQFPGFAKDPWALVPKDVLAEIAKDTAQEIAGWYDAKGLQRVGIALNDTTGMDNAGLNETIATAAIKTNRTIITSPSRFLVTVAPTPGNGNNVLAKALRSALILTEIPPTGGAYYVQGTVTIRSAPELAPGHSHVSITWEVTDPEGTALGIISQKNAVKTRILATDWGPEAHAAARAAAQGIKELLSPLHFRS